MLFPMPQLYEFRPVTESPCGMGKGLHPGHGAYTILGMIRRYEVTRTPDGWGIRDRAMSALCALDDTGPLVWGERLGAEGWLYRCRVAWGAGLVDAPDGWKGHVLKGVHVPPNAGRLEHMNPKTLNIALYLRLSRENDGSASVETQRTACLAWLQANGYALDQITVIEYVDSGVSGAKPLEDRKAMRQLMRARPDVVVAWKLDRYARSVSEFLRLVAWGEAHDVRIATTDNTVNTTTPHGRLVATLLATLAEWERNMIKGRITEGHATRRAQGRWGAGRAPYGYRIERRNSDGSPVAPQADGTIKGGAAYLAMHEEQSERIRAAIAVLLDGGTVTSTARMVDISEPQWRRLLKSPTLRGQREHKGQLVLAHDGITPIQFAEPIVSAAEAKAIRERLNALATGQDRAPRGETPQCAGMAFCYHCAGKLGGGKSDKGVRLYKCKAGHVTIYAETLDQVVENEFLTRWGGFAEYVVRLEGGNDLSDQMTEAQEQAGRLAERMATAGPLMLGSLEAMAEELEATYAALRAAHDPAVREVLEPTGRTLGEAWEAEPGSRSRLLADMGLNVTLYPKERTPRLAVEWAVEGGDDQEMADMIGDMEMAR